MTTTDDANGKWFILKSADAVAKNTVTTEEILAAYGRGALRDHTVIYPWLASRHAGITVGELVARVRDKK